MKIAIISVINESWGGSEELWAAMANEALASGHQVVYCTLPFETPAPKVQQLVAKGLQLVARRGYVPKTESTLIRQLKKVSVLLRDVINNPFQKLFDSKPDIVMYNGTTFSVTEHVALIEKWLPFSGTKIILAHFLPEYNTILGPDVRRKLQAFFKSSHATFFVSQRSLQNSEKALALHIPQSVVIRNPVNMPDTSIFPFPPENELYQLAMVGNLLCMHKGQDTMFEVLAQEQWKNEAWHLNIYGQGMDRQYLEDLANHYGIAHKITFHGRVQDIRLLWAQNHLLLMPSVMEGMPLAVVEAMLCGRPVLATDVGGHTEWIDDNVHGFIAASPSLHSLTEAWNRAWQCRNAWKQMGEKAHEQANALYDANPGKTLLNLIEQIVAKR